MRPKHKTAENGAVSRGVSGRKAPGGPETEEYYPPPHLQRGASFVDGKGQGFVLSSAAPLREGDFQK